MAYSWHDISFLLAPVSCTTCAHEDQVHAVLGGVCERHRLVVPAFLALDILLTRQSRVLHALLVYLEEELTGSCSGTAFAGSGHGVLKAGSAAGACRSLLLARAIDAVVSLVVRARAVAMTADTALVDQEAGVVDLFFLGLKHVVTLLAEAHTSESHLEVSWWSKAILFVIYC